MPRVPRSPPVPAASRRRLRSFPPFPSGMKGRRHELATLARLVSPGRHARIVLVGSGGSGKSMLACALGHRVARSFAGGVHWFRSGPWDVRTVAQMMAIRFGTSRGRGRLFASLRAFFASQGPLLVVLDNHENDAAAAALLNELDIPSLTWVLTARRCLLGGVSVFPIVAPLVTTGRTAFSRVRELTKLLRHSPLALSIADGIVQSRAATPGSLRSWLREQGVERVRVIDHEDDLPEVALLVDWAWDRLTAAQRRVLAVLAHTGGDHMDVASLSTLARAPRAEETLATLRSWRLVQTPLPDRYAVHAVVKYAIERKTRAAPGRAVEHYLRLLERSPERLDLEQTHLYAAMDYAHSESDLQCILRIDRLVDALAGAE